jgi:hypothetical protein
MGIDPKSDVTLEPKTMTAYTDDEEIEFLQGGSLPP